TPAQRLRAVAPCNSTLNASTGSKSAACSSLGSTTSARTGTSRWAAMSSPGRSNTIDSAAAIISVDTAGLLFVEPIPTVMPQSGPEHDQQLVRAEWIEHYCAARSPDRVFTAGRGAGEKHHRVVTGD